MKYHILYLSSILLLTPIFAFQWPVSDQNIQTGFLFSTSFTEKDFTSNPLPSLGFWFDINDKEVKPYHQGEIIYIEEPDVYGAIPSSFDENVIIEHPDELIFRYAARNVKRTANLPQKVDNEVTLFRGDKNGVLYLEVYENSFDSILNPSLVLPERNESPKPSQLFLEDPKGSSGRLRSYNYKAPGSYKVSLRFTPSHTPAALEATIDGKLLFKERFEKLSGWNSSLFIALRNIDDFYEPNTGSYTLGVIELPEDSAVNITIQETYANGESNILNYRISAKK